MALSLQAQRHPQQKSSALILTLVAMALLTVVVLAFLSRSMLNRQISTAYVAQSRADAAANTALQVIVGDLRDEITAGSSNYAAGTLGGTTVSAISGNYSNSFTVYQPSSAYSTRPQVIGNTDNLANLIKRSASGANFWTTTWTGGTTSGPIRAINSNSGQSSRNRSAISSARWNLSYLLTNTPTTLPDWCLIQRSGVYNNANSTPPLSTLANSASTNSSYVIGRFAYMVYNEGALIDVNVAGNNLGTNNDVNIRRGRLFAADLSVLPGMSASAATTLTSWRNPNPSTNWLETSTNSFQTVWQNNQPGEQTFVRRQDLINYALNNPSVIPTSTLPYLGTFTRQMNAPSWRPVTPTINGVTSTIDYASLADKSSGTNRDLANVRAQTAFVRYSDNTKAFPGDPLIKRRFPLSRLALVTDTATADTNSDIYRYFGLTRSSAGATPWNYRTDSSGNPPAGTILTLDQVAQAGREPDFFELLKAAILSGSLGKYSGADYSLQCATFDQSSDMQIIQIGANVIDQYKTDNNPTAINFKATSTSNVISTFTVYGIENLPYIDQVYTPIFRPNRGGSTPSVSYPDLAGWIQFELWNPHQNAANAPSMQFRVVATDGTTEIDASNGTDYDSPQVSQAGNFLQFTARGSDFAEPRLLVPNSATSGQTFSSSSTTLTGVPVVAVGSVSSPFTADGSSTGTYTSLTASDGVSTFYFGTTSQPSYATNSYSNPSPPSVQSLIGNTVSGVQTYSPCYVVGFPIGTAPVKDQVITGNSSDPASLTYYHTEVLPGSGGNFPTFQLQYQDSSGNWRPYQSIEFASSGMWLDCFYQYAYMSCTTWLTGNDPGLQGGWPHSGKENQTTPGLGLAFGKTAFVSMDPRSKRGGMGRLIALNGEPIVSNQTISPGYWFGGQTDTEAVNNQGFPTDPPSTSIIWSYWTQNNKFQPEDLAFNAFRSTVSDPDSIVRRADGFVNTQYGWPAYPIEVRPMDEYFPPANGQGVGMPLLEADAARPIVLNRPFRSVGEMGYAMRGDPWKTLNFFSSDSPDAALMDLFTVDDAPVVAGRVSLNTPYPQVLAAVMNGAVKADDGTTAPPTLSYAEATNIANVIVSASQTMPIRNVSELATRIGDSLATNLAPSGVLYYNAADGYIKTRCESAARALADVGDTRTWNLMIDVIAQAGRYPPNASSLNDFLVEGERRYWLHIAIDRYTGQIIAEQLEPVYE